MFQIFTYLMLGGLPPLLKTTIFKPVVGTPCPALPPSSVSVLDAL